MSKKIEEILRQVEQSLNEMDDELDPFEDLEKELIGEIKPKNKIHKCEKCGKKYEPHFHSSMIDVLSEWGSDDAEVIKKKCPICGKFYEGPSDTPMCFDCAGKTIKQLERYDHRCEELSTFCPNCVDKANKTYLAYEKELLDGYNDNQSSDNMKFGYNFVFSLDELRRMGRI